MSDVKLTCDMSNAEFVQYVRERCAMTIANTAAGVYMDGLANRLLKTTEMHQQAFDVAVGHQDRIRELEAKNERLRRQAKERDLLGVGCDQWIPMEERPPKKTGRYNVVVGGVVTSSLWQESLGWEIAPALITHWQPLPQPPEEE